MLDTPDYVIDSKVHEALSTYFHGVTLKKIVGDCSILAGVRKQNGALVDIFVPSYAASRDNSTLESISKQFVAYEKLNRSDLQAPVRCFTSRAFRKAPALAMLNCPVDVVDDAFETLDAEARLAHYVEALSALSALHDACIVHGAVSHKALRREERHGRLRLCDTGFSGGRQTTVVEQPLVYQSRKVINTSQPEMIDDVYAAGMLGYRLLLGKHGPEVLTGKPGMVDRERLAAAILGEDRPAPSGTVLFPEGHRSAEQIGRVLARMVGRLPNAVPYSSATTALKALRSVIEDPARPEPAEPAIATESGRVTTGAKPKLQHGVRQTGLSRTAAVALLCGCLATISSMVYFQQKADRLGESYSIAVFQLKETRHALQTARSESESLQKGVATVIAAMNDLRAADRAVITADLSGAPLASDPTAKSLVRAEKAHDLAEQALSVEDWVRVSAASAEAAKEATFASSIVASLREEATALRTQATARHAAAVRAKGLRASLGADLEAKLSKAYDDYVHRRHSSAIETWQETIVAMDGIVETHRAQAAIARMDAQRQLDRVGRSEDAANIRGTYLAQRADQAFEAGAFAESAAVYRRAAYTLDSLPDAPTEAQAEITAQLSLAPKAAK